METGQRFKTRYTKKRWAHPRERDVALLLEACAAMVEHFLTLCATPEEVDEWLHAVTELVSEYKVRTLSGAQNADSHSYESSEE